MTQPRLGTLTDSPADVVAQIMIDRGIVSDPDVSSSSRVWLVSVDSGLDSPDDVVEIHNTAPEQFGRIQLTGQVSEMYGMQMTVRAADPRDAWTKVNEIICEMEQDVRQTSAVITHRDASTSSYFVGALNRRSGPLYIGRESGLTKRSIYTVNWTVDITQLS